MSHKLINHSSDLKRLREDGYDIEEKSGYLFVNHVPYVTSNKKVAFGILISKLALAGDITIKPDTHVVYFIGEYPCDQSGLPMLKIGQPSQKQALEGGLVADHMFSSKPPNGYEDYYHKMTNYIAILSGPAQDIDSSAKAKTFPVIEAKEEESVFKYIDTATSRAEINTVSKKLEINKVAILGLGGTGSYVLDLVVKTPVKEIHLFDGDKFLQHNAFRSPSAASIEELRELQNKTEYFERLYSKMRRGIISHPSFIDVTNVDQLHLMNFVFICLDRGEVKKLIVGKLEEFGIPFVDVGMGVEQTGDSLCGILRITTSTPDHREHVWAKDRISFSDGGENNEYNRNIQIADLNALNAALAVIKWKKYYGFYHDLEKELFSTYTIDGNHLLNEDKP